MTFLLRMLITLAWLLIGATAWAQNEISAPPADGEKRHYAITLITAFEPVDISATAKEFPKQKVYLSSLDVLGKTVYFVRLGFFFTFADANSVKEKLLTRYPGAWATSVTSVERNSALGLAQKPPAPKPPVVAQAIQKPVPDDAPTPVIVPPVMPPIVPAQALPGVLKAEADASTRESAPVPKTVPTPVVVASPAPSPQADTNIDKLAEPLMSRGRDALTQNNNALAVQLFNELLNLPPNKYSQDAQEFIGLARERNGEIAKAEVEYKLYLKLYPNTEGAERVRQRLLNLGKVKIPPPLQQAQEKDAYQMSVYGSWSQYYYRGTSQNTDTVLNTAAPSTNSTSATVQSQLISSLDLNVRMRSSDYDNRAVIRDTFAWNFLNNDKNSNRLSSAYFELKNRKYDYSARLGRQPGNSGGVLGRFDGVQAGYRVSPKWQVNAVAGMPADLTISSDVKFYGLSVDMGTFAEHWSGSAYWITQAVDGITDRNAIGGDVRYYDPHQSYYSLVDYDLFYNELNIALLQANWTSASQTTYNLLLDYRNSPTLQTTNAVIGQPVTSVSTLLQTTSEDALHQLARGNTPISKNYLVGFTRPYNKTWQYGGDIRLSKISDTVLSPGTSSTMYTIQGIGTGLLTQRDISVLSYAYTDSTTYTANTWSFNNRSLIGDKWSLNPGLLYYLQDSTTGTHTKTLRPTLRAAYKWRENMTLEMEIYLDITTIEGLTMQTERRDPFYSLGYRWDF